MTAVGRSYRHPGPDLARVDLDASATGKCTECDRAFRSFSASTLHAAREKHTVAVTETRSFHVVPRQQEDHA